jgi:hypothetical protein
MSGSVKLISILPIALCASGIVGCALDAGEQTADTEDLSSPSLDIQSEDGNPKCKKLQGDLVEERSTTGCKPGHNSCFLGVFTGNHGLSATTYFKGDGSGPGPATSPGSFIYSGVFEYTTGLGTLQMRETGVNAPDNPERLAVTAFQKITSATGALSGASGHFFVSGFVTDANVITKVTGKVCLP